MESWAVALISGAVSGIMAAISFGYWFARNTPTTADLKAIFAEIRADIKALDTKIADDRHAARSNMDQRTSIFIEKVEEIRNKFDERVEGLRNKYDLSNERTHENENRITWLEAKVRNGGSLPAK